MTTQKIALSLMFLFTLVGKAAAVWPPETSLQEDETAAVRESSMRKSRPISDRLEDDTRRMEEALKDLKEDQKELKEGATLGQDASKFHDPTTLTGEAR